MKTKPRTEIHFRVCHYHCRREISPYDERILRRAHFRCLVLDLRTDFLHSAISKKKKKEKRREEKRREEKRREEKRREEREEERRREERKANPEVTVEEVCCYGCPRRGRRWTL